MSGFELGIFSNETDDYFREIKAPFDDIELLACSGVTPENIQAYFLNGASAVAFGASVFKKEWLTKRDFAAIGESIKRYLRALPEEMRSAQW